MSLTSSLCAISKVMEHEGQPDLQPPILQLCLDLMHDIVHNIIKLSSARMIMHELIAFFRHLKAPCWLMFLYIRLSTTNDNLKGSSI